MSATLAIFRLRGHGPTTNGNITSYKILVSSDNTTYATATSGTWPADGKYKGESSLDRWPRATFAWKPTPRNGTGGAQGHRGGGGRPAIAPCQQARHGNPQETFRRDEESAC